MWQQYNRWTDSIVLQIPRSTKFHLVSCSPPPGLVMITSLIPTSCCLHEAVTLILFYLSFAASLILYLSSLLFSFITLYLFVSFGNKSSSLSSVISIKEMFIKFKCLKHVYQKCFQFEACPKYVVMVTNLCPAAQLLQHLCLFMSVWATFWTLLRENLVFTFHLNSHHVLQLVTWCASVYICSHMSCCISVFI